MHRLAVVLTLGVLVLAGAWAEPSAGSPERLGRNPHVAVARTSSITFHRTRPNNSGNISPGAFIARINAQLDRLAAALKKKHGVRFCSANRTGGFTTYSISVPDLARTGRFDLLSVFVSLGTPRSVGAVVSIAAPLSQRPCDLNTAKRVSTNPRGSGGIITATGQSLALVTVVSKGHTSDYIVTGPLTSFKASFTDGYGDVVSSSVVSAAYTRLVRWAEAVIRRD